jgi:HEAT repeat protein
MWACIVVFGTALLTAGWGCEDQKFGEAERKEVRKVLQTGVDLDGDPYVQAETLRVFEMIKQPELNHFAEALVGAKDSPMVRVAALRVLMANDYHDMRRMTLARFNKAGDAEQGAILDAVFDYAAPPLRRVVTSRALRSSDPQLRRVAFERGPLARLEKAHEEGKTEYLKNTLIPEIGRYVTSKDEDLAAAALEALVAIGEVDRAEPLLSKLKDESAPREERLAAARILGRAKISAAVPVFAEIVEAVEISQEGAFVLPKKIDKELVRAATLGLVASGSTKFIKPAQGFLTNADEEQSLEVLTALAHSDHEDAAISLKIAMQDARQPVRFKAIELFADHDRATAQGFMAAMSSTDFESKKRLAMILVERFPEEWTKSLAEDLDDETARVATLEILRDVVGTSDEADGLAPLADQLYELATSDDPKAAPLAALIFVKVADEAKSRKLLAEVQEPHTQYAYLEHLVRTAPKKNVDYFRQHFYSDLYAIRLMSAAGMLLAYDAGVAARGEAESG